MDYTINSPVKQKKKKLLCQNIIRSFHLVGQTSEAAQPLNDLQQNRASFSEK